MHVHNVEFLNKKKKKEEKYKKRKSIVNQFKYCSDFF